MQSRWMGARLLLALAVVGGMRAATNDRCNDLLRQALENKNPDTRKQAVVALSLAATDEPVFAKLQGMLQDKDVEVRLAAVASLAEVDTASARAALRKALEDDVPEVSFAAAKALWMLHDPAGEQALLAVLRRESKTSSNFFSKQKRDALRMIHTPRTASRIRAGTRPGPRHRLDAGAAHRSRRLRPCSGGVAARQGQGGGYAGCAQEGGRAP